MPCRPMRSLTGDDADHGRRPRMDRTRTSRAQAPVRAGSARHRQAAVPAGPERTPPVCKTPRSQPIQVYDLGRWTGEAGASNPTFSASATSSSGERHDPPNGAVNTRASASLGRPVRSPLKARQRSTGQPNRARLVDLDPTQGRCRLPRGRPPPLGRSTQQVEAANPKGRQLGRIPGVGPKRTTNAYCDPISTV